MEVELGLTQMASELIDALFIQHTLIGGRGTLLDVMKEYQPGEPLVLPLRVLRIQIYN